MKIKDVYDFLKLTKKKKTYSLHFSTHDPLLWFLWKQVQKKEKNIQASKKVSYLIVKQGLLSSLKRYYPDLYEDFKRTFFFDDKNFNKWRRSKLSGVRDLIKGNLEAVWMKILRIKNIKRGGIYAFTGQVQEKEED